VVVLARGEVHTSRKGAVHIGFRILRVGPVDAKVFRHGVGRAVTTILQLLLTGGCAQVVNVEIARVPCTAYDSWSGLLSTPMIPLV